MSKYLFFYLLALVLLFQIAGETEATAHPVYTKQHVDYHMKSYQRLIKQQATTNRILRKQSQGILATRIKPWVRLAHCESGNRWHINTGNGYHGGLQFSKRTWKGIGGTVFAPRADLATPIQQVAVAQKLKATYGESQWECKF